MARAAHWISSANNDSVDSRHDDRALVSQPAPLAVPCKQARWRAHLPKASAPSPKPPMVTLPLAAAECCHTEQYPPAWPRGCPEQICSGSVTADTFHRGFDSHCCRGCRSISCRGRVPRNSFASNCHGPSESPGNPFSECLGMPPCVLERKEKKIKGSNILIH